MPTPYFRNDIETCTINDQFGGTPTSPNLSYPFIGRLTEEYAQLKQAFNNTQASASVQFVGSVVEWLTRRTDDQHGLGSKPTCAILLCPWERHFTALSPAWWS